MKTNRRVLAGAAAVAALVAFTLWAGSKLTVDYTTTLTCCMHEPGTGGGLAVARWAEALGQSVRGLEEPVWEAVDRLDRPTGNCVITAGNGAWSPWGRQMTRGDWQHLWTWMERGNTLIVITSFPQHLPEPLLKELGIDADTTDEDFSIDLASALRPEAETTAVTAANGEMLVGRKEGPRWNDLPEAWQLAGDARGSVLNRIPGGEGALYVLLDEYAWVNHGFDRGANARILAQVLEQTIHGGDLAFDEYRHGHGQVESFVTFAWSLPGASTFIWIAVLLGGFYVYGRNRRFGPPEPFEVAQRRTAAEYIDSVAYLYQRARAAPLAMQLVVQRIRFLAHQRDRDALEAEEPLKHAQAEIALRERPANPSHACRIVFRLIQLRKRLYGS